MITRLTSVRTRDVAGLPDLDVRLMPVTVLVGPRGSGKSRFLAATAWLLLGEPPLAGGGAAAAGPVVSAELSDGDTSRTIEAVAGIRSHEDKVLKA